MAPEQKPNPNVDLDLDVLAPPARTFQFRGEVYRLPADIPVPTLIQIVTLREQIDLADGSSVEDQKDAVQAMFDVVMNLVRAENGQDTPEFQVSVTQLLYMVGMILSGVEGISMDAALIATLGGPDAADGEKKEEDADHPPTRRKPRKKAA